MEISAATPLYARGTILAGGTLSSEFDLADSTVVGLLLRSAMVLGTLSFMVSGIGDAQGGVYYDLKGADGANVSMGPVSGTFAVSALVTNALIGYRYVRVKTSSTQTNGVDLYMPGRP